ncbi:hypothetical protein RND71_026150 [Anisodus tanguticus]|uniref:Uncharacterized protein n=1 Tax=Anisodus tanguticus TaxID=243964 RepID=A0AAE1RLR9_9SOLA|nr:hypothetical protein RND71_026150 [Anisodus tanguticus]
MIPVMREHIQNLDHDHNPRVLINSFDALEEKSMAILEKIGICSIGPLIPSVFYDGKDVEYKSFGCDLFDKTEDYWEWLDSKDEGSVEWKRDEDSEKKNENDGLNGKGMIVSWCSQIVDLNNPRGVTMD